MGGQALGMGERDGGSERGEAVRLLESKNALKATDPKSFRVRGIAGFYT